MPSPPWRGAVKRGIPSFMFSNSDNECSYSILDMETVDVWQLLTMGAKKRPQKLPVVTFCSLVYTKEVFSIVGQKTKVEAYKKRNR